MKREKKPLGTGMSHLLGMLQSVPMTMATSIDFDVTTNTEEVNVDLAKAEINRARTFAVQASRLTFA